MRKLYEMNISRQIMCGYGSGFALASAFAGMFLAKSFLATLVLLMASGGFGVLGLYTAKALIKQWDEDGIR